MYYSCNCFSKDSLKINIQEMPMFFPAAVLCREYHMMKNMMDMDTGSHVLTTQTKPGDVRLHT